MTEDARLLRDYAVNRSEAAFAEFVERHANLVYSVALRGVDGDAHLACDVAQVVFTDLARRAASLSEHTVLGGWLHRHTFFTATKTVRAERRRRAREQEAIAMQHLNDDAEEAWRQLAPVLDEAMNRLSRRNRDAIVLRFFEERPFRAVGEALGVSEDAARKRVERALAVLRGLLVRRAVALPAAVLATALGTKAVSAAPAGLALQLAQASTTAATASTTGGAFASLLNFFAMTKLQTSVLGLLFVAGTATPLLFNSHSAPLRKEADPAPLGLADGQGANRTNGSAGRRSNMRQPARPGSSALAQLESWLLNEDQRNPTSGGMDDELRFRIWSLAATDYSLAWKLRDRLRSEAVRSKFQNEMLRYWAQLDPPSAMAAVQEMAAGRARQQAEAQVLARWGEKDPSAALAWAREAVPEDLRHSRLAWAADGMARRDPKAAAALLSKLPDGPRSLPRHAHRPDPVGRARPGCHRSVSFADARRHHANQWPTGSGRSLGQAGSKARRRVESIIAFRDGAHGPAHTDGAESGGEPTSERGRPAHCVSTRPGEHIRAGTRAACCHHAALVRNGLCQRLGLEPETLPRISQRCGAGEHQRNGW